jgi:hypothetical protein
MTVDETRLDQPVTGIPVRCMVNGRWQPVDINHLDTESLIEWLDESPHRARNTVLALLGHDYD